MNGICFFSSILFFVVTLVLWTPLWVVAQINREQVRTLSAISNMATQAGQSSEKPQKYDDQEQADGVRIRVFNPYVNDVEKVTPSALWGLGYVTQAERHFQNSPLQGLGLSYWWRGLPRLGWWSGLNLTSSQWFKAGQLRDQWEVFMAIRPVLRDWGSSLLSAAFGASYSNWREFERGSGLPVQSSGSVELIWASLQWNHFITPWLTVSAQLRTSSQGLSLMALGFEWF